MFVFVFHGHYISGWISTVSGSSTSTTARIVSPAAVSVL